MKNLVTILTVALVSIGVFAQSPQTMSYQAVVRNSSNALVASTTIGMQISILQKSSTGDPVYMEKHSTTTNANGLATIEIGGGTPVSGRFETIDWSSGPYFLKTETDPTGGSNYSISGTSKLLSVPYALYAEKSGKSGSGDPWLTKGNTLTAVGTNFLGTIDSQPLMFKVYNTKAGYIDFDYNIANTGLGFQTLISNTTGHSNTANGYQALQSNTTGVQNSAIGKLALSANSEGSNNIALGSEALSHNTSGSFNVAAGTSTMRYNTVGNYNTANGIWSLYNNNKGSYNTAYGTSALQGNIDGNNNTAIGYAADVLTGSLNNATAIGNGAKANTSNEVRIGNKDVSSLYFGTANNLATTPDSAPNMYYNFNTGQIMRSTASNNDSGNHWTLIGNGGAVSDANFIGTTTNVPFNIKVNNEKAGRIDQVLFNTFFGYQSGNAGPTGKWNTGVGNFALRDNTTGHDNSAFGDEALTFNTTGNLNTALGEGSLFRNTTGDQNTASGYSALGSNTTGKSNTANGAQALIANVTGDNNTAIGVNALQANLGGAGNTATGSSSLFNTIGKSNTGFGFSTLSVNTLGSNNTALGYNANVNSVNINNSTVLGANAIATASNEVRIGNNSVSSLYFGTANNLAVVTDSIPNMFYDRTTGQIMRSTAIASGTGGSDNWKLTGNTGTIDNGTFYIGTTDNVPLNFKVNNVLAGRIDHLLGNVFFGSKSGLDNTTGQDNTAIGDKALTSNTTGVYNTATGFSALFSNLTGNFNSAFGNHSLKSNTIGTENAAFGSSSLFSNTEGYDNAGFGYGSLYSNTTGSGNSAFGAQALKDNSGGSSNSAFGHLSLAQNTASNNSAFGYWSLSSNTIGNYNAAFGSSSLNHNITGNYNTAVGPEALLFNTSGNNNASLGTFSLQNNTTGSNNSAFGFQAGNNVTTETSLTLIGANAGINASGYNNSTAIGYNAIITGSNMIKLGDNTILNVKTSGTYTAGTVTYPNTLGNAGDVLTLPISGGNAYWSAPTSVGSTTNWSILGNASTVDGTNFIGTTDDVPLNFRINNVPAGRIDKSLENTFFGYLSGNTAVSGTYNTGTGAYSLASTTTGSNNTAFGRGALRFNTTGMGNTATGYSALVLNADGTCNTANGAQALQNNTSGVNNTSMGYSALINNTTGGNNSAIGLNALQANLGGEGNTASGSGALLNNTTGNYNTGFGYGALYSNTTGSNNTALGNNASVDVNNLTNATALGYNARAAGSNNLILGNNNVNVGIGLSGLIPQNKLEINAAPATNASGLRFRQLTTTATPVANPGTGVLTVDASGDVIYVTASSTSSPIHTIGEVYGGGTIFYVYDNGLHGLIAAPADQSASMRWDNGTAGLNTMAMADGVCAGKSNNSIIISSQGYGDGATYAARVCNEYFVTAGGVTYGDWYLPSKFELNLLFLEKASVAGLTIDAFTSYWCSTEYDGTRTWTQTLGTGYQGHVYKTFGNAVRAIRAF